MTYFCYIHRQAGGVPHFEVLPETSQGGAIDMATQLLAQRGDAVVLADRAGDDPRLPYPLATREDLEGAAERARAVAVDPSLISTAIVDIAEADWVGDIPDPPAQPQPFVPGDQADRREDHHARGAAPDHRPPLPAFEIGNDRLSNQRSGRGGI